MSAQENIRAFIVDNFLFGEDYGLKDDSSFLDQGFLDSTGIMQLVAYIEETFAVKVEDEELVPENLDSITKVASFLARKAGRTGD
jgi:acyl carrier protein